MTQYIPAEHYKGTHNTKNECPLAFITPYGTDSAAKKRMETVDSWCGKSNSKQSGKTEVIKNEPQRGFKIANEVRRWSTSNVVWRIEDPRGFQLEISSGNMAYLIAETILDKGEFKAELVWCRDNAQNYLLPVGSAEYAKYTQNTASLDQKLSIRDLTIGDHIHDITGVDGIFLGGYYALTFELHAYNNYGNENKFLRVQRKYFLKDASGKITSKNKFKGLSITEKGKEEEKDHSNYINANADKNKEFVYVFKKKPNELAISKTAKYVPNNKHDSLVYYAQIADGGVYQVYKNTWNRDKRYTRIVIDSNTNSIEKEAVIEYGNSYHSMSTFGLNNPFNAKQKIQDLIREDSQPVKLVITINDNDFTIFE